MTRRFRNYFPTSQELWPVLSTVVVIVFSWTIYRLLYQMPGWLFYLTIPDILSLIAYTLGFALLESLVLTGLVAACNLFWPVAWIKKHYRAIGLVQVLLITCLAYCLRINFDRFQKLSDWQLIALPLALLLSTIFSAPLQSRLFDRFPKLADWLKTLGDRLTIFSYIYIPLGGVGWLVVLLRNLR